MFEKRFQHFAQFTEVFFVHVNVEM